MKTVTYTSAVDRQLARLAPVVRERIEAALQRLAISGEGNVKALTARPGYRMRVGDHRIVFESSAERIDVLAIGDRKDIYR